MMFSLIYSRVISYFNYLIFCIIVPKQFNVVTVTLLSDFFISAAFGAAALIGGMRILKDGPYSGPSVKKSGMELRPGAYCGNTVYQNRTKE